MTNESNTKQLYTLKDKRLCYPISMYILLNVLFSFGTEYIPVLRNLAPLSMVFRYGIPLILFILAFRYLSKKAIQYFLLFEFLFGISYSYSLLFGYLNWIDFPLYGISTLLICIPFMASVMSLEDYKCLYDQLLFVSYINSFVLIIYLVISATSIYYSMPATYQLLFCAVMHCNEIFDNTKNKRMLFMALILIEGTLIFIKGARGPIFCLGTFILIKSVVCLRHNKKVLLPILLGVTILFTVTLNMESVIVGIGSFLQQHNISSRMYTQIISNTLFVDSGRSQIQELAFEYIKKSPIVGYGAAGELKLLNGAYPHSIIIELMLDFGVIVGLGIFLSILLKTIRTLWYEDDIKKQLGIIFTALGLIMLFLSGTYLQNIYIFMFFGLTLTMNKRYRIVLGNRSRSY